MSIEKISTLILLQFLTFNLFGQCGNGMTIILSNQTEVNNFINNFCTDFEGNLHIIDDNDGQDNILNVDSLLTINKVDGVFQIRNNHFLETFSGFDSISHVGALRIMNNSSIQDLEGFNSLSSVNGDLIISQNENLMNFDALSSLGTMQSPFGYIEIKNNEILSDISGLSALSSYVGGLIISDNGSLASLNGLQNVKIYIDSDSPIVEDIEIFNNAILNGCNIQSVCEALNSMDVTFEIYNNGINCSSKDDILSNCTTSTSRQHELKMKIYPNPFKSQLYIKSPIEETLTIYNSIGQLIKVMQVENGTNKFDFSRFEKGIYLFITQSGVAHKVVKF